MKSKGKGVELLDGRKPRQVIIPKLPLYDYRESPLLSVEGLSFQNVLCIVHQNLNCNFSIHHSSLHLTWVFPSFRLCAGCCLS